MGKRTTVVTDGAEHRTAESRKRGGTLEERQTEGLIRRWLYLASNLFDQDRDNDPTPTAA